MDTYASQPAVWVNKDGTFVLAWERTGTPDKNYIRLRYYKSIEDLKKGEYSDEHDIARTLAPDCEGTPSFEDVKINGDLTNSEIKLRFHFYENSIHDQQAIGTLKNWSDWESEPMTEVNAALQKLGFNGNLGSR